MSIHYRCRHCRCAVGELDQPQVDMKQLGLDHLNIEERKEFVSYETNGDVVIKTICEDCQEALERNPDYHQIRTFIQ
ncbi:anti-sigma-F factor Fin family protein [Priestia koreensis]|uniref:anti-sigma-F factor Fin family protein n=1 Tax=Priestia koreensis TaxID=284581 RepID=UPI00301AB8D0